MTFFRGYGTAIVNLCISALDVFLCDDEWHEPVASEVGGIGAHARQFEFSTLAVIADGAGTPFTANKMKFAAPTAHDSKLYWHALIMLRSDDTAGTRDWRIYFRRPTKRAMLPEINRCLHCGLSDNKQHIKNGHKFERDNRLPRWHGWHAARRGLGTNLYRLGVPDKVIQAILRHSNVSVTLGYYVKPQSEDVIAAMSRFEAEMAAHELRDSNGTVNRLSGAMPKSVN